MAESLSDLAPAIIPFLALLVGLFVGRLLAIKPERGERGDVGEPGMTGPMGVQGEKGEPGDLAPHTHRIREIEGLAEILGVDDSPRHALNTGPDPDAPGTVYRAAWVKYEGVNGRTWYGKAHYSLEDAHDEGRFNKPGPDWKTYYEFMPPGGVWTQFRRDL